MMKKGEIPRREAGQGDVDEQVKERTSMPGKPKGPDKPQEGSLVWKLLGLRIGEMMIIPDEIPEHGATQMERQIGAVRNKSPHLSGRDFKTVRVDVIVKREMKPMLLISRSA